MAPAGKGDVRKPERLTGLARGDDRRRRAAGAVGVLARRVRPQAERDADRLVPRVAGAEQRNRAVHAAAHRDGDALVPRDRGDGGPEGVVERVGGEPLAGDARSLEEGTPLDLAEQVGHAGPVSRRAVDPLPAHAKTHPREIPIPGGVPYELTFGGHEKRRCPTPPMMLRA
jgi:hypothetical protein